MSHPDGWVSGVCFLFMYGCKKFSKKERGGIATADQQKGVINAATSVSPKKSAMVSHTMRSMIRTTAPMATQSEVPDLLFLSLIINSCFDD